MKLNDLKNKNLTELKALLQEQQVKLAQMRFDLADGKIKKTSEIAKTRRQIARIMTLLKIITPN